MSASEAQIVSGKDLGFNLSSFALQYTSVMLIILSILTGAYLRPEFLQVVEAPASPTKIVTQQALLPESRYFTDLFVDGNKLDLSRFSYLVYLANHHDLVLDFKVYGDADSSSNDIASSSLARSVELFRGLVSLGIPEEAIRIKSEFSINKNQVELNIRKGV